jgi:hypothetical protein
MTENIDHQSVPFESLFGRIRHPKLRRVNLILIDILVERDVVVVMSFSADSRMAAIMKLPLLFHR